MNRELGLKQQTLAPARRRRMCVIEAATPIPVCVRDVSARTLVLETRVRLPIGAEVTIRHPKGGRVSGSISGLAPDGMAIALPCDSRAAAFALAVIAAGMPRSAA